MNSICKIFVSGFTLAFGINVFALSSDVAVNSGKVAVVQQVIDVRLTRENCTSSQLRMIHEGFCDVDPRRLRLPSGGSIVGAASGNSFSVRLTKDEYSNVMIKVSSDQISFQGFNDDVARGNAVIKLIYQGPAL